MSEFRIGKIGKKILQICKESKQIIGIGNLMFEVYDCKEDKPFNNQSDYHEYDYKKFLKLTLSQKVSLYNAVKRLEKRNLIKSEMVFNRFDGSENRNHSSKEIKLTKLGVEYISKHLTHIPKGHELNDKTKELEDRGR